MVLPTDMFRLDYLAASLVIPCCGISIEKHGISELIARLVNETPFERNAWLRGMQGTKGSCEVIAAMQDTEQRILFPDSPLLRPILLVVFGIYGANFGDGVGFSAPKPASSF